MALPNVGGGRQVGDGNASESTLISQGTPGAVTDSATLTAAQLATGLITANKGSDSATTMTLPTGTLMDATFTNAHVDSATDFCIVNANDSGSSSTVTVAAGTGFTVVGAVLIGRLSTARFRARKTATATWVCYRLS